MDTHDCHDCVSTDGVTFTCPTCGREYQLRHRRLVITNPGDPDIIHTGAWGVTIKFVDATAPVGPARPELFGKN